MSNDNQGAGPFKQPEPTTAQILGQYARDLKHEGLDSYIVRELVQQMASRFDADDLRVSPLDPDARLVSALKAHRALAELFVAVNPPERPGKCGCQSCGDSDA